jgi:hypothetical protein
VAERHPMLQGPWIHGGTKARETNVEEACASSGLSPVRGGSPRTDEAFPRECQRHDDEEASLHG